MTRRPNFQKLMFFYLFAFTASLLLLVWTLRGFSILGWVPGYVIWFLLILSIVTGVLSRVSR